MKHLGQGQEEELEGQGQEEELEGQGEVEEHVHELAEEHKKLVQFQAEEHVECSRQLEVHAKQHAPLRYLKRDEKKSRNK